MRLEYTWIAALLVILAVIDWIVAVLLTAAAWKHKWGALTERAIVACIIAVGASICAILGVNRALRLGIPSDVALAMLVLAIVVFSLASLNWLYAYASGKLG